jgi:hypothetical protein
VDEEEAEAAVTDAQGTGRAAILVLAVQEVLLKLGLRDLIGRFMVKLAEHAQGTHVGFLSALAQAVELKGIDRFLVPVGHHGVSSLAD